MTIARELATFIGARTVMPRGTIDDAKLAVLDLSATAVAGAPRFRGTVAGEVIAPWRADKPDRLESALAQVLHRCREKAQREPVSGFPGGLRVSA